MTVVGIDPSLTGCAVWTSDGAMVELCSDTSWGPTAAGRKGRYDAICDEILDLVGKAVPTMLVIEGNQGKVQGAGISLVEFSWHLKNWCLDRWPDARLVEVPPTSLKKWATGRGSGDKVAMASALTKRYGEEFQTNNLADAFALMMFGRGLQGHTKVNADQKAVYKKLGLA